MNTTAKFLPDGFSMPKAKNERYMKLVEGDNRFRILSSPVFGFEEWSEGKPLRYKTEVKPKDASKPMSYFMAMIVWNVTMEQIQILQLKQVTILRSIMDLCVTEEWGSPFNYDIRITRKGKDKDTEYLVSPMPHKPIHDYVIDQFYSNPIYLEALFEGADPFANHGKVTPTPFSKPRSGMEMI